MVAADQQGAEHEAAGVGKDRAVKRRRVQPGCAVLVSTVSSLARAEWAGFNAGEQSLGEQGEITTKVGELLQRLPWRHPPVGGHRQPHRHGTPGNPGRRGPPRFLVWSAEPAHEGNVDAVPDLDHHQPSRPSRPADRHSGIKHKE